MRKFDSVEEVLDFAIEREEESYEFYTLLAEKMEHINVSKMFLDFAKEELGHKRKLESIKEGKRLLASRRKVTDLRIGDYLVDAKPSGDMGYQDALILAMKKEKAAFKLYNDLAGATDDGELRNIFLLLAQEEAKHKLRFEIEYDDQILSEN